MNAPSSAGFPRRTGKAAIWIIAALLLLGVLGFFAGPPIAKSLLTDLLTDKLHRPVSLGRIAINPFLMTVKVTDVKVGDKPGGDLPETAGFDELFVDLDIATLYHRAPVIKEFRLVGPRIHLVRETQDRYNVSDLLDEWLKPSDSPPAKFSVNNIGISKGTLRFDDRPPGKQHLIADLHLALPFISNLPHEAEIHTEPKFSAIINGAPLALHGRSKPFAESHESELDVNLTGVEIPYYLAYSPVALPFAVGGGRLDTELKVRFRGGAQQTPLLAILGQLRVSGLQMTDRAGHPLLALGKLDVPLVAVEPLASRYAIGGIAVNELAVHLRADRAGSLNWLDVLDGMKATPGASGTQAPSKPAAKPPEWSVAGLQLSGSSVHWLDESNGTPLKADISALEVSLGSIDGRFANPIAASVSLTADLAPHAALKHLAIQDAKIDVPNKRLALSVIEARGLKLELARLANGSLALPKPPALKAAKAGEAAGGSAKVSGGDTPWTVEVGKAELNEAALRFDDRAVTPAARHQLDVARLSIEGFSTAARTPGKLTLAAKLNRKADLQANGLLQLEPLATKLNLSMRGIELLPLQPYFGDRLNLTVTKGQVSAKGELALNKAADGALTGGYRGQVDVGDFHSVDRTNSEDFLSWKSFHLDKIDVKLQPFALGIGEVALTDFFARLIVSPEGKLNLLQIVRKDDADQAAAAPDAKVSPAAAPPPAKDGNESKAVPPIRVDQVTLQGGTVSFSDRFVKPNYSANLGEVGGRISGLSSTAGSTADLDLRGAYDGAPVSVAGKINPLAAVPSLDLKAEVRGVELVPMSPYSGKYAGYAIDKGKLSLFLAYKIDEGKLQAENRVFLDQLTFGQKVDSPSATRLPVTLAVSLLQNRRGEIDINLPISGSLNDPEFSVGGIIVQVLVNLITKAITAPFALLGSLFGGGEELSHAEFALGRATLDTAAVKRLETLAKALEDRPGLKLEIVGRVDADKDPEGLRRAALERKVKAQKLAQLVKAGDEVGGSADVKVDDKEYVELLEQAYKQEKFPKPRNFIGMAKSLPREEMEKLMLANAPAGDEELRDLANRRAKAVMDWLTGPGKIARERIFLLPPKLAKDDSGPKDAPLYRADFLLK